MTPILLIIKKELEEELYLEVSENMSPQYLQVSTDLAPNKIIFIYIEDYTIMIVSANHSDYMPLQSYPISDPNSLDNTIKLCAEELLLYIN